MPNLTALSNITTAASALSGLILVSPQKTTGYQPQNKPILKSGGADDGTPPPSFLFNYEGEQAAHLQSDITDHYVEDNTAINDQIALKPEIITTQGFIGELNDVPPLGFATLNAIANKLTAVGGYVPSLSVTALNAYNEAVFLYASAGSLVNSAVSSWNTITGQGGTSVIGANGLSAQKSQNKQQLAFQQFYGYWRKRTLFTIQTPWAIFQNMAIMDLQAVQSAETNTVSTFEITFKMLRFASTITALSNIAILQGRAANQAASLVNLGTSTPSQSSISFISTVA